MPHKSGKGSYPAKKGHPGREEGVIIRRGSKDIPKPDVQKMKREEIMRKNKFTVA